MNDWNAISRASVGERDPATLDAYLEDATPEVLRNALATIARSHGISDLARRSGVSRPGIYKALGEDEERSHAGVHGEHHSPVVRKPAPDLIRGSDQSWVRWG